jgi:hypothetical protein
MNDELEHILFEIDESFIRLLQFTYWNFKLEDLKDWNVYEAKEKFRWDVNELLSYTRALRDKLENED